MAKITVAAEARRDADFLLIARTGAVANESYDAAIERCNAYAEAGADLVMLFPTSGEQWRSAPRQVDVGVAAMTAFGSRPREAFADLGYKIVIDPFTGQKLYQ